VTMPEKTAKNFFMISRELKYNPIEVDGKS